MAALAGELWKHALPDHDIFNKIRENINLEHQTISNRFSKNLTFCLDRDFFIWNDIDSVFFTTNLGELNSEEGLTSAKYQVSIESFKLVEFYSGNQFKLKKLKDM